MDAKLAGLTKNVTTQTMPSDQQLENFYQQNKTHYREPSTLWVWVVGFSTAIHGGQAFERAQLALDTPIGETPKGDSFDRYDAILSTELAEKYGQAFSTKLLLLGANNDALPCWAGPISSAQGAQLVCVKKIDWGAYTPLEEIRSQLINDWRFSVATDG
jgi:alpha-beta hydrolase superfamily lysophospholipase